MDVKNEIIKIGKALRQWSSRSRDAITAPRPYESICAAYPASLGLQFSQEILPMPFCKRFKTKEHACMHSKYIIFTDQAADKNIFKSILDCTLCWPINRIIPLLKYICQN